MRYLKTFVLHLYTAMDLLSLLILFFTLGFGVTSSDNTDLVYHNLRDEPIRERRDTFLQSEACMAQNQMGLCYGEVACSRLRGKVQGYCSGLQGACCIFYRSCYGKTSQEISHFRNELWPAKESLEETCSFSITKKDESYCGLRVRLVQLSLPGYVGRCSHTFFWISGVPRRNFDFICGQFYGKNYDFNITSSTEVFLKMKSYAGYRTSWSMVVTQIKCSQFFAERLPEFGDGAEAAGSFGLSSEAPPLPPSPPPITTQPTTTTTTTTERTTTTTTTGRTTTPYAIVNPPIAEDYSICGIKGVDDVNIVFQNNFDTLTNRESTNDDDQLNRVGWAVPELKQSIFHKYRGSQTLYQRITHGQIAGMAEFPWQIAIFINRNFHCGGSIISNKFVMTAAHCVSSLANDVSSVRIVAGKWDISQSYKRSFYDYHVESVHAHKEFSRFTLQNDIALVKVTRPIVYNKLIRPICLPITRLEPEDELAYVTGWGRNQKGKLVTKLHKLKSAIVNNTLCNNRWTYDRGNKQLIAPTMVCMDAQNGDSCNGDSGGPSVLERPFGSGQYVQVGVVSFGSGSCIEKSLPGVYTRVSSFMEWIQTTMSENGD